MDMQGEDEFRALVEEHRATLHAHCYRMLGSLHDADDALQDTLLRAWRGLPAHEGRSTLRTWLYRIATNVCLDAIARRSRRVLPIDYGPPAQGGREEPRAADSLWIEPYPDELIGVADGYACPAARYEQREAVELAFIAALQHLPPRQRAVLILRDVLGFSARETAAALDTTVASVNSTLQRARKAADERLPERSQQATLRALGDERLRALVDRFIEAFANGDVKAILALLADDATFAMPPYPSWYRGRDAIARSWLMPGGPPPRLRYVATTANGQPAVGTYLLDGDGYRPIALDVLALRGEAIAAVTAFRTPTIFPRFGLPQEVPA
jgi:RNA polymerase sigma-70 factor (ECF subfamily)